MCHYLICLRPQNAVGFTCQSKYPFNSRTQSPKQVPYKKAVQREISHIAILRVLQYNIAHYSVHNIPNEYITHTREKLSLTNSYHILTHSLSCTLLQPNLNFLSIIFQSLLRYVPKTWLYPNGSSYKINTLNLTKF